MKLRKNNFLFLTQFIQFHHGAFSITWMLFIKYINRQKESILTWMSPLSMKSGGKGHMRLETKFFKGSTSGS